MKTKNIFLIVSVIFLVVVSLSSISLVSAEFTGSENYSSDIIKSSGGTEVGSSGYDTKTVVGTITGKTTSGTYKTSLGFFPGLGLINKAPNDPDTKLRSEEGTNYSDEYLECYSLIEDSDGDRLDAYVRWYKNGELYDERAYENGYSSGTDFEAILSSAETDAGDVWKCGLRIHDGEDYSNWVNSSNLTVRETPEPPPPGPEPPPPGPVPPPTEEAEFEVEPGLIKFTIKQGNALRKEFKVKHIKGGSIKIDISKNTDFLKVFNKDKFTLEPNETETIKADFYAAKDATPDAYSGNIRVTGNNNQTETINLIIVVEEKKPLFDVITHIDDKTVNPGDKVTADVRLLNMGDLNHFDVLFRYSVKDLQGNTITYREESLAIDKELNLTRSLEIPSGTEEGQYLFYANVRYGDVSASGTETFRVVESVIPKIAYYLIAFILLILIIILLILIYRKYKELQRKKKALEEEGYGEEGEYEK